MSTSISRTAVAAGRRKPRSEGWIPRQHGAWAMLLAPSLLAIILSLRRDGAAATHLLPLLLCWVFGYFAFSAISGWLKVRRGRRAARYLRPIATWTGLTLIAGLIALSQAGWQLLLWAGVYLPLIAGTLWLVADRRERATVSGLLTVAAACLIPITILHPNPTHLEIHSSTVALSLLCFGYFFGTVLYVKTLIRHRGEGSWLVLSIGWHALVSAAVVFAAAATSSLSWSWAVFFDVVLLRAILVPLLGPMSGRGITPKQAGIGEIVLTVALAVLVLVMLT